MTPENFLTLRYFTQSEVIGSGANIKDVKFETMYRLDSFRHDLGVPVYLLNNGLTTGKHSSPEHPNGEAADVCTGAIMPVWTVYKCALKNQFRGFGVYWNGIAYSYHLDIGSEYRQWTGVPDGKGSWNFGTLIVDPKNLYKRSFYYAKQKDHSEKSRKRNRCNTGNRNYCRFGIK